MNYCEIEDFFTSPKDFMSNDKEEKLVKTDNSAKDVLEEYECLRTNLIKYKDEYKELNNQKDVYDEYLNNLLNKHMSIINIINNYENDENMNECFNNYL